MSKPTYYLWQDDNTDMEKLKKEKQYWKSLGYRVTTFMDGDKNKDINEGIKEVIKNHIIKRK